jgi:GNAT superfamily N-acetyltransferase
VSSAVRIRPLADDDVVAADEVSTLALFGADAGRDDALVERARTRIRHLAHTDPGGAWAAEAGGRLIGVALALVREGVWGLSLLAVEEGHRGAGVGRRLLAAAWEHGREARGHIILSSTHPAAMRAYASLGLELRPCVAAAGIVDRDRIPGAVGVEDAGEAGIPAADAIGRAVRGAGHGRDLAAALQHPGTRLLLFEDRAFALLRDAQVGLLGARDDEAAARVLWAAFAAAPPGASAAVDFITAGQDWAVRTCLDAGLALSPEGPVFTGGALGPLRPYLPSGAWL